MPSRNANRTLEEIAQAEDSADDDYDDKAPGPAKSRSHKSRHHSKKQRKRVRTGYGMDSDVASDTDELQSHGESYASSDSEEEPVETNERGRPVRSATKKAVVYEESASEVSERSYSDSEEDIQPVKKPRRALIVKLRTGRAGSNTPAHVDRATRRTRSGSYSAKQLPSSPPSHPRGSRRSNRLSHDEDEAVVALSNSGNHVEIIQAGSRDPDIPQRALRGGKGLKYPSKSTIDEEEGSFRTKDEPVEELEIRASQHEIMESGPHSQGEAEEEPFRLVSDIQAAADELDELQDENIPDAVPDSSKHSESEAEADNGGDGGDDDDDDDPIGRGRARSSRKRKAASPPAESAPSSKRLTRGSLRDQESKPTSRSNRRRRPDESSDFELGNDAENEDDLSESSASRPSPRKSNRRPDGSESSHGRRGTRSRKKNGSQHTLASEDDDDDLAAEIAELKPESRRKRPVREEILFEPRGSRRAGKKPNYDLLKGLGPIEEDEDVAPTPSQRNRRGGGGGGWQRSLLNTYGPFGGAGGVMPVFGGPGAFGPSGTADSDSSDDEVMKRPKPVGGTVGMTPTSAFPGGFNFFPPGQPLGADPAPATAGTPANLGKIKDKQALADADPLGVDPNVNFDSVGGLGGYIDQLKEMVALPLLYPEIFMRFHITPPRGVLFHGPPGTGKTLMARALASSVSSQGRKVTFYMRKGADALSKWVGEAERQLRLLFDEARKNQPSIIFFDEIDGLAPVRSSKQEQIHASIVSTLLALMDGMDGRGQVIVIGATNRPDSIDPALRRPGRFDREFYFPLPNTEARRAILDIHTKGWNPPLDPSIRDELAALTKGYGGADLRALCTEAALNAVQRQYPQIYSSNEKLLIDPKTIEVTPKDFMISVKKLVPSSERSASSGASPLPESVEPLLRRPLAEIKALLANTLPQKKPTTALEEAQYEDVADGSGFGREKMQQAFESSRVFRPRLLLKGLPGMGQQYVAAALLNHFEGLHVQSFDLPTLLSDSTSSPEATVVRLFSEVKTHKPSVIYIPDVQAWYMTVGQAVISTFLGLLRSVNPTDPILLLGVLEGDKDHTDPDMLRDLFGYSKKNQFLLEAPQINDRRVFFEPIINYILTSPKDFPDPENRKKRILEVLPPAPPEPEKSPTPLTKEQLKAQKKRDHQTLNLLKIRLQPIMDQIRTKHKKFRSGVIDDSQIRYLYDEVDPGTVSSDLPREMLTARASFRPFEIGRDKHGVPGLVDQANDRFYYNIDTVTVEKRLSNGHYKRPKDFLADIRRLAKDAKTIGDEERLLKANEMLTNVEVDVGMIEAETAFAAECEKVAEREEIREKEAIEKAKKAAAENRDMPPPQLVSNVPQGTFSEPSTSTPSVGAIVLGEPLANDRLLQQRLLPITPSRPSSHSTNLTNGVHPGGDSVTTNGLNSRSGGNEADCEGDTPMGGTESHPNSHQQSNGTQNTHTSSSFGHTQSAQPRPLHSYTAPSQAMRKESGMSAPLSQTGVITPMAVGSQPADYQNEASTTQTTSGKKYSAQSSAEREQPSQGDGGPDLWTYGERQSAGGSQIPDTQGRTHPPPRSPPVAWNKPMPSFSGLMRHVEPMPTSPISGIHQSSPQSTMNLRPASSQGQSLPPVPVFDTAAPPPQRRASSAIESLLNHDPVSPVYQLPPLLIDHTVLTRLHTEITDQSSGCSVEQLEQINTALMDTIWKTRGDWDRTNVAKLVGVAFGETLEDMRAVGQDMGHSSWGAASYAL